MERYIGTVLLAKGMIGLGGVALAFAGCPTQCELLTTVATFF